MELREQQAHEHRANSSTYARELRCTAPFPRVKRGSAGTWGHMLAPAPPPAVLEDCSEMLWIVAPRLGVTRINRDRFRCERL